jgi:CHAT domain-containing protein
MNRSSHLLLAVLVLAWPGFAMGAEKPEALVAEGAALAERGESAEAFKRWDKAAQLFAKKRDGAGEFDVLLRQIAACQALGQQKIALTKLARTDQLAGTDKHRLAQAKGARGAVSMYARQAGDAEALLRDSAKLARATRDGALEAAAQHNLGLVLTGLGEFPKAREAIGEALRLARASGDSALAARVRKTLADTEFAAGAFAEAKQRADEAAEAAAALPDGRDKAFLLMGAARVLERVFRDAPEHENALRLRAFKLHAEAAAIAARMGDPISQSYALGYQGGMYEFEKKYPEALALTHRALALAQQAQAPDALYRWQWQVARLMAREGERDAAIEGYRRAVTTLQGIRNDVSIRHGNRNAGSSFREVVGGLYFELADLILQRADGVSDDAEKQKLFREARSTAELLKSAELEDYFQDDCVSLRRELTKNVENLDPKAAVIYYISLADRTEILVSLPASGTGEAARIERFKATPNDDLLTETARTFRSNLEDRTSYAYVTQAQQLYTWLIKPVESLIEQRGFNTLIFVPDGALRTIPMAALHDGQGFLVEKYAVAVTPGLELMEVKKSSVVLSRMLVSGLSDSVQGFSALPAVTSELESVARIYGTKDTLRDRAFSSEAVSDRLKSEQYSIVHLATHGVFRSDVRKSFVLTHDNQLTLDDLERLIRPGQLRDQPLELLTLSACETAAGDDRAALGLAGVAVKAGARSAFASLWSVNDRASASLIADFYTQLRKPGNNKAQALQIAQKKLLKDPSFGHPCYWAPYLLIGNWL